MDWLKQVAPTLATALLGPLGGLAVQAIGAAVGIDQPTRDKVEKALTSGQVSGEQLVALKSAELAFAAKMKELDIDVDRLHVEDRKSARDMQIQTKSRIPGALALMITMGFFGILIGMMTGSFKASENQALLIMLGALGAAWGAVVNFYYGSSRGSEEKNAMLARK